MTRTVRYLLLAVISIIVANSANAAVNMADIKASTNHQITNPARANLQTRPDSISSPITLDTIQHTIANLNKYANVVFISDENKSIIGHTSVPKIDIACTMSGYKFTGAQCEAGAGSCAKSDGSCQGMGLCSLSAGLAYGSRHFMDCCEKRFKYNRGECPANSVPGATCGGKFDCACPGSGRDVNNKDTILPGNEYKTGEQCAEMGAIGNPYGICREANAKDDGFEEWYDKCVCPENYRECGESIGVDNHGNAFYNQTECVLESGEKECIIETSRSTPSGPVITTENKKCAKCGCLPGYDKTCSMFGPDEAHEFNYCSLYGVRYYKACKDGSDACEDLGYTNQKCEDVPSFHYKGKIVRRYKDGDCNNPVDGELITKDNFEEAKKACTYLEASTDTRKKYKYFYNGKEVTHFNNEFGGLTLDGDGNIAKYLSDRFKFFEDLNDPEAKKTALISEIAGSADSGNSTKIEETHDGLQYVEVPKTGYFTFKENYTLGGAEYDVCQASGNVCANEGNGRDTGDQVVSTHGDIITQPMEMYVVNGTGILKHRYVPRSLNGTIFGLPSASIVKLVTNKTDGLSGLEINIDEFMKHNVPEDLYVTYIYNFENPKYDAKDKDSKKSLEECEKVKIGTLNTEHTLYAENVVPLTEPPTAPKNYVIYHLGNPDSTDPNEKVAAAPTPQHKEICTFTGSITVPADTPAIAVTAGSGDAYTTLNLPINYEETGNRLPNNPFGTKKCCCPTNNQLHIYTTDGGTETMLTSPVSPHTSYVEANIKLTMDVQTEIDCLSSETGCVCTAVGETTTCKKTTCKQTEVSATDVKGNSSLRTKINACLTGKTVDAKEFPIVDATNPNSKNYVYFNNGKYEGGNNGCDKTSACLPETSEPADVCQNPDKKYYSLISRSVPLNNITRKGVRTYLSKRSATYTMTCKEQCLFTKNAEKLPTNFAGDSGCSKKVVTEGLATQYLGITLTCNIKTFTQNSSDSGTISTTSNAEELKRIALGITYEQHSSKKNYYLDGKLLKQPETEPKTINITYPRPEGTGTSSGKLPDNYDTLQSVLVGFSKLEIDEAYPKYYEVSPTTRKEVEVWSTDTKTVFITPENFEELSSFSALTQIKDQDYDHTCSMDNNYHSCSLNVDKFCKQKGYYPAGSSCPDYQVMDPGKSCYEPMEAMYGGQAGSNTVMVRVMEDAKTYKLCKKTCKYYVATHNQGGGNEEGGTKDWAEISGFGGAVFKKGDVAIVFGDNASGYSVSALGGSGVKKIVGPRYYGRESADVIEPRPLECNAEKNPLILAEGETDLDRNFEYLDLKLNSNSTNNPASSFSIKGNKLIWRDITLSDNKNNGLGVDESNCIVTRKTEYKIALTGLLNIVGETVFKNSQGTGKDLGSGCSSRTANPSAYSFRITGTGRLNLASSSKMDMKGLNIIVNGNRSDASTSAALVIVGVSNLYLEGIWLDEYGRSLIYGTTGTIGGITLGNQGSVGNDWRHRGYMSVSGSNLIISRRLRVVGDFVLKTRSGFVTIDSIGTFASLKPNTVTFRDKDTITAPSVYHQKTLRKDYWRGSADVCIAPGSTLYGGTYIPYVGPKNFHKNDANTTTGNPTRSGFGDCNSGCTTTSSTCWGL